LPISFLRLAARDKGEAHRAATPLELMFDLASVIAIATAAAGLHHGVGEGHWAEALPGFLMAFFMIWWSWMNYTWFASAYDDGSAEFRILSLITMFGALTIAAGIPAVFSGRPIVLVLTGFVIMRLVMALFWLGAAKGDPARRRTALGYAAGIFLMQVYWVSLVLSLPPSAPSYPLLMVLGFAGELAVPAVSERFGATTWHRHHIIERYGLMNIIVLGECFLSIEMMLRLDEAGQPAGNYGMLTAVASAAITFSLWGLYFTREDHLGDDALRRALLWGYGHFVIFAAGAATGAGFAVFHEVATGHAEIGMRTASFAVAWPIAIYLGALWMVRDRFCLTGWSLAILPATSLAVLATPMISAEALLPIAGLLILATWLRRMSAAADQNKLAA
jgi:low temperature requirement protein LtrA